MNYVISNGCFELLYAKSAGLELYNLAGQRISSSSNNVLLLPTKGLYIVKVKLQNKQKTIKIVW